MHLRRRNHLPIELQVPRGARVMNHRDRVAQVRRRPHHRVDAHVAHAADHYQVRDAALFQQGTQVGLAERIHEMLEHHRLVALVQHFAMQVRTLGARREERCVIGGELMAHMNHRIACLAKRLQHLRGFVRCGVHAVKWPLALGEVVVLDID